MRFFIAGVLLLAWSFARGERFHVMNPRQWLVLTLLAACNHAVYLGLSWSGMRELSSGLATIIIGASPIVIAILAVPLLDERMTMRKIAGLMLGFVGVIFIVQSRLGHGADTLHGALLVISALMILSLGTVLFKRSSLPLSLQANVGLQLLMASAILLPWAAATESWGDVHFTTTMLEALLWAVFVVSLGGYLLWFTMLKASDASAASAWMFLTPPLGLLMGWLILDERLEWSDFIGVIPVVIGIVLVTYASKTPKESPLLPTAAVEKPGKLYTQ